MISLSVNVDHVATVRQARRGREPDPVQAAVLAELAGARGITVHLREDRRHIQDRDVHVLRHTVRTRLNLEMAATDAMVEIALRVKPDQVTLVPEKREELTTEGGLDVHGMRDSLAEVVGRLQDGAIAVSCFVDPDADQIKAAARIGADSVELHTGTYATAGHQDDRDRELDEIVKNASLAAKLGLSVAAGHGLDYQNASAVAAIREVEELAIGHSIVSRALMVGMDRAVRDMRGLIEIY